LSAKVSTGSPDLLPQRAVVGEGEDRIDGGARVLDREAPGRITAFLCCRRERRLHVGGNALQLGFADDHVGGLVRKHPLGEGRKPGCELLVVIGQLRLLGRIEVGAATRKAFVQTGQQAVLLGV
jgi:hypothetical protein